MSIILDIPLCMLEKNERICVEEGTNRMNKKNSRLIMMGLGVTLMASVAYGFGAEPGTINDPLVTKSYVDQKVQEMGGSSQNNTYQVVFVPAGEVILGKQGTEIILRSGKARAVDSTGGGLQDMTDGVDVVGGQDIARYHLMIIPRDDGRGMVSEKDCTFMVRGGYEIQ